MKFVEISKDLSLPAEDFLESAIGVIGKRGSGKSGAGKVIMEELYDIGLPFIMLDPIGIHWGIRSSFDGTAPSGRQVLIVGGSHGDIPLDRRAGAEVAKAIVQANVSAVVDFSDQPKAVYREFVETFAHTLYAINDTSRMVLIEEAPELVPQRLRPDMTKVFEAVERLVSRGRNRGIGVTLISQRAATINKDVLTQIDALFVFGVTSPQDRKALREWVEAKADDSLLKEFEDGIAGLQKQEAWAWAPSAFKEGGIFQKVRIRNFTTFHPDKTHLRRRGLLAQKPVMTDVPKIVQKLSGQLARLAQEKVDLKDVSKMQTRIRQLEKDNELMRAQLPLKFKHEPVADINARIRVAVKEATDPLKAHVKKLEAQAARRQRDLTQVQNQLSKTLGAITDWLTEPMPTSPEYKPAGNVVNLPPIQSRANEKITIKFRQVEDTQTDIKITNALVRILCALNNLHGIGIPKPTKVQAALWAGYSPKSGGYANNLGQLRSGGLVDYGGSSTVYLTAEGKKLVDEHDSPELPSTIDELREQVFRMVGSSKARILNALVEAGRVPISKSDLAVECGFSPTSGGYANNLGNLRSMGLIEYVEGGVVGAEVLFP